MNMRPLGRPMKARPRILSVACEMFLQHGLDVSLDSIAVQAGTTRQTLYNHFPTKNTLILETFQFLLAEMQPSVKAILEDGSLRLPDVLNRVASVIQNQFYQERFIQFQRLLMQLLLQNSELFEQLNKRPSERVKTLLKEYLDGAKLRGEIKVEDTEIQTVCFLGAIMGYHFPAALISRTLPEKAYLEAIKVNAVTQFLKAWDYQA